MFFTIITLIIVATKTYCLKEIAIQLLLG